jgi:hypothetical protein
MLVIILLSSTLSRCLVANTVDRGCQENTQSSDRSGAVWYPLAETCLLTLSTWGMSCHFVDHWYGGSWYLSHAAS